MVYEHSYFKVFSYNNNSLHDAVIEKNDSCAVAARWIAHILGSGNSVAFSRPGTYGLNSHCISLAISVASGTKGARGSHSGASDVCSC